MKLGIKDVISIMGENFVGPEEIYGSSNLMDILKLDYPIKLPPIHYSYKHLIEKKDTHLLVFINPYFNNGDYLTIRKMRNIFGFEPLIFEPCFYNQDWYLKQNFLDKKNLSTGWYLISKFLLDDTRGNNPIRSNLISNKLPSAQLCTFIFFVYFILREQALWKNDYVWCSDFDDNGDRIYVGRYFDENNLSKNGFSIHRHLKLTKNYGCIDIQ